MYVYLYLCMYTYIYIIYHRYVPIYVCITISMYTYIHAYISIKHMYIYTCINPRRSYVNNENLLLYIYIYIYIYIYLCGISIVHKRVLSYHIYIGEKSKIVTQVRN